MLVRRKYGAIPQLGNANRSDHWIGIVIYNSNVIPMASLTVRHDDRHDDYTNIMDMRNLLRRYRFFGSFVFVT